jgi:hypothetical protein
LPAIFAPRSTTDVEDHEGRAALLVGAAGELGLQALVEVAAVGDAGELVGERRLDEPLALLGVPRPGLVVRRVGDLVAAQARVGGSTRAISRDRTTVPPVLASNGGRSASVCSTYRPTAKTGTRTRARWSAS